MKITFCLAVGLVPVVMFPLQSHASENQVPQTPAVVIEVVILVFATYSRSFDSGELFI